MRGARGSKRWCSSSPRAQHKEEEEAFVVVVVVVVFGSTVSSWGSVGYGRALGLIAFCSVAACPAASADARL